MFSKKSYDAEHAAERQQIREMVEFERYCRDYGRWEEMKEIYHEDATVKLTWFEGTGYEFVEQSKKLPGSRHKIYNTVVEICGKRAVAEIMAQITSRQEVKGIMADLMSDVRLLYRLKKEENGWKIYSIDSIYEKDALLPLWGMEKLPKISRMGNQRESYLFLGMILEEKGIKVDMELPGEDRPEKAMELYAKYRGWLEA